MWKLVILRTQTTDKFCATLVNTQTAFDQLSYGPTIQQPMRILHEVLDVRTDECANSRIRYCPYVDVKLKLGGQPIAKSTPLGLNGFANTSIDTLKLSDTSIAPARHM